MAINELKGKDTFKEKDDKYRMFIFGDMLHILIRSFFLQVHRSKVG